MLDLYIAFPKTKLTQTLPSTEYKMALYTLLTIISYLLIKHHDLWIELDEKYELFRIEDNQTKVNFTTSVKVQNGSK